MPIQVPLRPSSCDRAKILLKGRSMRNSITLLSVALF